jgi:DNA-binding NtrC family response regulator
MTDSRPIRFLIVDEQQSICSLGASLAQRMGLLCLQAHSAEEALERVGDFAPELMLADMTLRNHSGLELLAKVKKRLPLTEVAMMSANGTIASAVQAMRLGAYDFVVKPFRVGELKLVLEHMAEKVQMARENKLSSQTPSRTEADSVSMLACTDLEELERLTMHRVFEQVDGDKEQAQKLLGISRATLYRKIKRYGIQTRQVRQPEVTRGTVERMVLLSQR